MVVGDLWWLQDERGKGKDRMRAQSIDREGEGGEMLMIFDRFLGGSCDFNQF